jgi:hypothetical protein
MVTDLVDCARHIDPADRSGASIIIEGSRLAWRLLYSQLTVSKPFTFGGKVMTVRLVKRKELEASDEKQTQPPSSTQLLLTTQAWVEEFKARKARTARSRSRLLRQA